MKPINAYNHTVNTLEIYRRKLGVSDIDEVERKWTMWGAIFYALTVYTTIGSFRISTFFRYYKNFQMILRYSN